MQQDFVVVCINKNREGAVELSPRKVYGFLGCAADHLIRCVNQNEVLGVKRDLTEYFVHNEFLNRRAESVRFVILIDTLLWSTPSCLGEMSSR